MENENLRPQMTIGANDDPVIVKKPNNVPAILLGFMLVAAVFQLFGAQFLPKRPAPIAPASAEVKSDCSAINAPQTTRELTAHGLRPTIEETDAKPAC